MGKRLTIKQAVEEIGLSEYVLRSGIASGRFPHIRTSGPGKGRILIDLDLMEQYLKQEAIDSTRVVAPADNIVNYGKLRRVAE